MARWEEPHHPGPWVNSLGHANPLCPTLQHDHRRDWNRSVGRTCYPAPRGSAFRHPRMRLRRAGGRRAPVHGPMHGGAIGVGADAEHRTSEPPPGADRPTSSHRPDLRPVPDDADDTRGVTCAPAPPPGDPDRRRSWLAAVALIAVGARSASPIGGAAAGRGSCSRADRRLADRQLTRAREDFFNAYAQGRGLTRIDGKSNLPPITPLLHKGDYRYAEQRFNGVLPGGIDGSLCLYTYEDTSTRLRRQPPDHLRPLHDRDDPAAGHRAPTLQELYCQRRFGFRFMDSAEDVFRSRQRVEQESEGVDKKLRDLHRRQRRHEQGPPDPLPLLPRLARGHSPEAYAFELCAGIAGLQRQGPQEVGRRARHALRGLGRGRPPAQRGGGRR